MTRPGLLVTISVPRTGSSHFINHLRPIRGVRVFGEVFHRRATFSLKSGHFARLAEMLDTPITPDIRDPATIETVRTHPDAVLDVLREFSGARATAFKLFPGHLPLDHVVEDLLRRDDLVAIVLQRRPIDSFASAEKARQRRTWRVADTTGERVEGDAERYAAWAAQHRRWYRATTGALEEAGRPYTRLRYDEDLALDGAPLTARIVEALTELGVDPVGVDDLAWSTPRQDNSAHSEDKFANWADFAAELDRRGLLDEALSHFG